MRQKTSASVGLLNTHWSIRNWNEKVIITVHNSVSLLLKIGNCIELLCEFSYKKLSSKKKKTQFPFSPFVAPTLKNSAASFVWLCKFPKTGKSRSNPCVPRVRPLVNLFQLMNIHWPTHLSCSSLTTRHQKLCLIWTLLELGNGSSKMAYAPVKTGSRFRQNHSVAVALSRHYCYKSLWLSRSH